MPSISLRLQYLYPCSITSLDAFVVSLDNSNYWQFHKTLGEGLFSPLLPSMRYLKEELSFYLLRGMEESQQVPVTGSYLLFPHFLGTPGPGTG